MRVISTLFLFRHDTIVLLTPLLAWFRSHLRRRQKAKALVRQLIADKRSALSTARTAERQQVLRAPCSLTPVAGTRTPQVLKSLCPRHFAPPHILFFFLSFRHATIKAAADALRKQDDMESMQRARQQQAQRDRRTAIAAMRASSPQLRSSSLKNIHTFYVVVLHFCPETEECEVGCEAGEGSRGVRGRHRT